MYTQAAVDSLTKTNSEAWPPVAARVLLSFRASMTDPERPYITEHWCLWRAISTRQLAQLFDKLVELLLPNPLDHVGISGILQEITLLITEQIGPMRVESHNLLRRAMTSRAKVAEDLHRICVDVLSARVSSYQPLPTGAVESSQIN